MPASQTLPYKTGQDVTIMRGVPSRGVYCGDVGTITNVLTQRGGDTRYAVAFDGGDVALWFYEGDIETVKGS